MNKALRKAIIAGNWKMNKNRKEAAELINALKPIAADKTCGVIICVPFTNLETALSLTEGTNIEVGAWVLAHNIQTYGWNWNAVGAYNAKSPHKREIYIKKVARNLEKFHRGEL